MKLLTEQQLTKLKCECYEDGFQHGKNMKKKLNELWFHAVCMYIDVSLMELEKNTWDKNRVQELRRYINCKEQTFGEFTTGGGFCDETTN